MSCFFFIIKDCIKAVDSGEQARMIIVRDSGTRDSERRFRPMFNEKDRLRPSTSKNSVLAGPNTM